MSNVWEDVTDWGGVGALRLDRPDACALGASVWELQPGGENWNHLHHGSEEMIVVLRGRPTLRTPEGGRVLAECPLPVAGLFSVAALADVIAQSRACNDAAAALGWSGATPFLTVSFLALSVIPALKITDQGLVDVERFELVPLCC